MNRTHPARLRRYWQGLGWETRASAVIIAISALALAGYLAVSSFSSSSAVGVARTQTYVPLVKRLYAKPVTVEETRTVQTPGGTRIVTRPVVRYQTVYRDKVVTVKGKPVTVSQVVTNSRMLTDTQMLTVTNERTSTVVQHETVNQTQTVNQTLVRTQTTPPETVTVTTPGDTVTETVVTTLPLVTVMMPVIATITVTTTER